MNDNEKWIELAKKLKALADQGVGGEKTNADQKLKNLMESKGISLEDIQGRKVKDHMFDGIKVKDMDFFHQIVMSVNHEIKVFGAKSSKTTVWLECTDLEAIEVQLKFDFYLPLYEEEQKVFYTAFIVANGLFSTRPPMEMPDGVSEDRRRADKMAQSIKTRAFHKQLKA